MNEIQIAKITHIILEILKSKDIFTHQNIVADKTIYAKEGLYINDFNPNFDFFVKGNSCITGDLKVNGNIIYQKDGSHSIEDTFLELTCPTNGSSGLIIKAPNSQNGIFWNEKEETFLLSSPEYLEKKSLNSLCDLTLKNLNVFNNYSKNLLIETSIIPNNQNERINLDGHVRISQDLILQENLLCRSDVLNIKSRLNVNSTNINGSLFVSDNLESKNLNCHQIYCQNIDCSDIKLNNLNTVGEVLIGRNLDVQGGLFVQKSFEFKSGGEISGNLYLKQNLIFNGLNNKISFPQLSEIENASVSYIHGKKVNNLGEIVTTDAQQILSNKKLGSNLDCQNFSLKNIDNPTDNFDAVPKRYVDQFIYGVNILEPCHCTTQETLGATFLEHNGQLISDSPERLVIDGIEVEINQRILVKNQKEFKENGIYYVVSRGGRNQQWILQYADDYAEMKRNRERITPLFLSKYGETSRNILYGLNMITQSIFEFMPQNKFLEDYCQMWEKLELKINHLNKICQNLN